MLLTLVLPGTAFGDNFSQTYVYGGTDWTRTNFTDEGSYYKSTSNNDGIATIPGIFTGRTITSDVVITLNVACYGNGSNPTSSKFSIYTSSACTTQVTATQGGTLPNNSTYTNTTYTVTSANAASFSDDLAVKVAKGTKLIRLKSIKVEFSYTSATPTAATPTFSPADGFYTLAQNVTISTTTPAATIYYTTDGTNPTTSSTQYTGAISVTSTTTIKAMATATGYNNSSVATANYVILQHAGTQADPYSVADARAAIDANTGISNVYARGIVCTGGSNLSSGAMNYWISDDGTQTNKLEAYKGKGIDGADFTSTNDVQVGDVVVIYGTLKKYNSTYEFDQNNQLVSLVRKYTVTYDGNDATSGTVPVDSNDYDYEETVTVLDNTGNLEKTGYTFNGWNAVPEGSGTHYAVGGTFTINQNTTLYAQWTGIKSDINISAMTGGSVTVTVGGEEVEEASTGETVTLEVSPEPNHVLNTLTVTKGNPSVIVELTQTSANTYTFTMPAVAVTVTATFSEADIYALYSGDITEGDYVIYYSGKALKNSVTSNRLDYSEVTPVSDQIVDPDADIVWHISKSGDYWKIYNAADDSYAASNGTDKQAALDDGSDTKSSWIVTGTSTYDFENVYKTNNYKYLRNNTTYGFACYQSGTGGALTLYKKVVYPTLAVANNVANGTITATPAGGSAIAEGSSNTVSSGTTITLSATGEGTYVLDAWDVYKTGDASTKVTVTNNQFTMPDYGVIVSASFRQPTTFTVSYSVNGEIVSTQSNIAEGSPVTLPTDISAPTGFTKVGWTENEVSAELISTATYTPTDNTTLYLVFVKSGQTAGYNKVTSLNNITPGTYIIVNDNHCLPNVSTGSNGKPAKTDDYTVTNASSISNYTTVPANTEWFFTGTKTAMTIKNASDDYLYAINDNAGLRVHTTSDTWAFETNSTGFAMKEATNNKYCATYNNDWRSYGTKNHSNYSDGGILYIYKKTPVYTRVYNTTTTTMANIPATSIVTVPNGVTLTLTGTNQGDETNLIIEDGGQLICSNSVKATFNKNIIAASTTVVSDENWYLISSPVGTVNTSDVTNLLGSGNHKYNLYKFNETSAAWNGNGGENHFETLAKGMGYLYRNNDGADLSFTGTTVTGDYEYDVELTRHATALPGFNLLGNPYSHNITSKYITLSDDAEFNGCYVLETDGTWTSNLDNVIKPGEGFFVQVSKDATATFHETAQRTGKYNEEYIQFMVSNNDYKDVTYALFDKGIGLKKIDHRNSDVQMVYIKQNNEDYAIATMSDDTKSFDLCFKSKTIGQYTLKYKTHGEFNYIHVIDRMTGEDIDMLVEREYKFISAPKDSENRFIVKLGYLPDYSDVENDIFAFQNGSEILVSGEGELQIFDVTGRNVMTTTINGAESINIPTQGVYIFRLIGTEVKTQKIVVR